MILEKGAIMAPNSYLGDEGYWDIRIRFRVSSKYVVKGSDKRNSKNTLQAGVQKTG